MAFQFGQPYIDPHNGQEYHSAFGKIISCFMYFRSDGITPCVRISCSIFGSKEQMDANLQPVDTVEKIIIGAEFGEIFHNMWESVSEPTDSNELDRIEQNLGVIFGEQFVETEIVPTDADQEIRNKVNLWVGSEEQTCEQEGVELVPFYIPVGQSWLNSKLYVNEEPGDTQVWPSIFVWDTNNWRQWQANEGNTDGFYIGPINECGGQPSDCVEWEFQLGEEVGQLDVYIKNPNIEISAFHLLTKNLEDTFVDSVSGGQQEADGFSSTVYPNENQEGLPTANIVAINFSGATIPMNEDFIHLITINYNGPIEEWFDMLGSELLASARISGTEYVEGMNGKNFDWPTPDDPDGTLNVLDIVQSIGFLGAQYMLDGFILTEVHNMSESINDKEGGGIENIAAATNAILEEGAADGSYATNYCDTFWIEI
jgi:hypothetical protein